MSTISISLNRRITEKVKPPRALLVGFPLGHPMGNPFDHALQKKILVEALKQFKAIEESGAILDWTGIYGFKGGKYILRGGA
jgi:hypothetical protein